MVIRPGYLIRLKFSKVTNKEISKQLRLIAALGELHGENPFKLKSYVNAAFQIDRASFGVDGKSLEEIMSIPGIGKSIAGTILAITQSGTCPELDAYLEKTPDGIVSMLKLKGIGPKKIAQLWRELGVESPGELLYACYENRLIELKGFGPKIQDNIREVLEYRLAGEGKLHLSEALMASGQIQKHLAGLFPSARISEVGELRRWMEVISDFSFLIDVDHDEALKQLANSPEFEILGQEETRLKLSFSGKYPFVLVCCKAGEYFDQLIGLTGPPPHLLDIGYIEPTGLKSEEEFYESRNLPFILPELRDLQLDSAKNTDTAELVNLHHIRGIIHAHSTWSDGADTLREMALAARDAGYSYLAITDHSRSAIYANGLSIERLQEQHQEIDLLNKELAPFRIIKGIESDILNDGSLDYPDEILNSFELVIASVHSVLRMDEERATKRIIKAVENPHTHILGHSTGRLLLSRPGYPLDHIAVIDACAANGVSIELNSHPFRLDIDWRWIPYCIKKGVRISVNPDAHAIADYRYMSYGVQMARKGGLLREHLLNGLSADELLSYLS